MKNDKWEVQFLTVFDTNVIEVWVLVPLVLTLVTERQFTVYYFSTYFSITVCIIYQILPVEYSVLKR